jgi:hypothetical protein
MNAEVVGTIVPQTACSVLLASGAAVSWRWISAKWAPAASVAAPAAGPVTPGTVPPTAALGSTVAVGEASAVTVVTATVNPTATAADAAANRHGMLRRMTGSSPDAPAIRQGREPTRMPAGSMVAAGPSDRLKFG